MWGLLHWQKILVNTGYKSITKLESKSQSLEYSLKSIKSWVKGVTNSGSTFSNKIDQQKSFLADGEKQVKKKVNKGECSPLKGTVLMNLSHRSSQFDSASYTLGEEKSNSSSISKCMILYDTFVPKDSLYDNLALEQVQEVEFLKEMIPWV